jgi:HD-GYP domain-containing protein (c-di-GMP phosphodiesterase class II)
LGVPILDEMIMLVTCLGLGAALERQLVHIPDLAAQHDNPRLARALLSEAFVGYFAVPLVAKGKIQGVLEVFQRTALEPNQEWLDFLNTLAGQAAIAIDNATLFDSLQHSNTALTLAYEATIEGWSRALDLRDKETEGHSQRVTTVSEQLARSTGMSEEELVQLRRGALLHDTPAYTAGAGRQDGRA